MFANRMEIDMENPLNPVLWIKGKKIALYGWKKKKPLELCSIAGISVRKRFMAREFYKEYGVTPSDACKFLNNGLIAMSLGDLKGFEKLCYSYGILNPTLTVYACEMKDELEQAKADGLMHIAPFIVDFKRNPKELKKFFGNALWKVLTKNTYSRNKYISDLIGRSLTHMSGDDLRQRVCSELSKIVNVPSTILRSRKLNRDYELMEYLYHVKKIPMTQLAKCSPEIRRDMDIVRDTRRMAALRDESFSYNWSWRRMEQEHRRLSEITQAEYRFRMIEWEKERAERDDELSKLYAKVLREGKQTVWEYEGVSAKFLTNYKDMLQEGENMHHCAGGYTTMCLEETYALIHIDGEDLESTLGLSKLGAENRWTFGQHYGKRNTIITNEKHNKLVDIVIEALNKELESEENDAGAIETAN